MKREIALIGLSALLAMGVAGCGTKDAQAPAATMQAQAAVNEFANAPKWVVNPSLEGGLSAVGSAKVGKAGMQFARTEAMAHARDELARITSMKIKNMVKNFTQVTGVGDSETVDRVSSQVSRQVTSEEINGSRQKDTWMSASGELYVLVVVDTGSAKKAIKDAVQSSFKSDQALWQKYQEQHANDELDKEIDKELL